MIWCLSLVRGDPSKDGDTLNMSRLIVSSGLSRWKKKQSIPYMATRSQGGKEEVDIPAGKDQILSNFPKHIPPSSHPSSVWNVR